MISLSLGARIDAKRRARGRPGASDTSSAPVPVTAPVLDGSGRIGDRLRLQPGDWEGRPEPAVSVRWLRDGREIPGATGPDYLPGPDDDGTAIAARVIARNAAGTRSATTAALPVTWSAPEAGPPIPDQFHILESGEHVLNVSSNFDGGALRFSVTGEGVSIDPETGILSIATDALREGVSVTVTAVNSGGAVAQTFRLDVALPEIALPVAPAMVAAPGLPEIAAIGTKISVEAGTWSGTPAPDLTYQWLFDGVEIAGATDAAWLPLAAQDGGMLACRVTATNAAGTAEAVSPAAAVRHAEPAAAGGLADLLLDAGSGPVTVAAGAEFSGENLVFSVTGAGAAIDSATGLVTISTDELRDEESIVVTASNSGGSATSAFRVTVQPVAPRLRAAPSLDGTGTIGEVIAVEPGLWDGAPAPEFSFRWICGGETVAGATDAAYVPGPAEDGKDLVCEVTATNAGGSETAATPPLALVLAAPRIIGTLADISAEQGTPALEVDAAAAFAGERLVFAVAGAGATIDAGTGLLTLATDVPRAGSEVVVTASNSGGTVETRFRVDITEAVFVPVPPVMLAGPVLLGSAKVGAALTVETGNWGGDPVPGIACQWLRDGAPIEGATGIEYVPDAADDLAEIACRVTASNSGGSAEAVTAALTVTHVAPEVTGEILEEILDEGTGPQEVPTADAFEGLALVFAVDGANATIEAGTGVVSIPTETPVDGAVVTVTASNSGGTAETSFLVTVEAAEPEIPEGPPLPLADDQWQILRSEPSPEIAAGSFRPVIAIDAGLPVQAAQWTTSGSTPPLPEHWETLAPAGEANTFVTEMLNQGTGDWHVFTEDQDFRRTKGLRIRYRLAADGEWAGESGAKAVPLPEASEPEIIPKPEPVGDAWSMLHFSSKRAFENRTRYRYGVSAHQIQFCHGGARSEANPNDAAFIMDVGGPWVTENAEADWPTYRLASCRNLEQNNSVSLCWDPDIPGRFLYVVGNNRDQGQTPGVRCGIYESTDKGETMRLRRSEFVLSGSADRATRSYRNLLTYDPGNHDVWYFLNPEQRLLRSADRGATWSDHNTNAAQIRAMGQVWYLHVDRGNSRTLWFGAENGLFRSTNGGTTIARVTPSGLPAGAVTGLCFDPDAANRFLAVVYDVGIFRTTDGGASFSRVSTPHTSVCQVFQSPVDKNVLWAMGINQRPNGQWSGGLGLFSSNGGSSWQTCTTDGSTYGIDRGNPDLMRANGLGNVRAMQTGILPSPLVARKAIGTWGHCLWATQNGGHWVNASDGFSNQAGGDTNFGAMSFHPDGRILFAAFDKKGFVSDDNGDTWRQISIVGNGMSSIDYVGLTLQGHPTKKNKFIATMGFYTPNPGTVIISDDFGMSASNSRRPAFFRTTYGNNDFQKWAQFHPTKGNIAYSTTAFSNDEGDTWTRWVDRADATYRNGVGEPANAASAAGVRMASPKNGDWLIASHSGGRRLFLSKDIGRTWKQFTSNGPDLHGADLSSLWMDPTDENIIYWWRRGTGMVRYDERTGRETVLPDTVRYRDMRVQRIRSDYNDPDVLYFFNRLNGGDMVFRSTTGPDGTFEDISGNLPRQIGNQGFEIDPATGILWMNGVIGTRIFPPPGGHPRYDELARRARA